MPIAKGRTTANKKVVLPGGGTVLVPVITQLNVVDPTDRYQETDYTVVNNFYDPVTNQQTHRQTHVDQIDTKGNIDNSQPYPPGNTSLLPVERVDVWPVLDPVDRAQETDITLFNDQANYNPSGPPFFTRHKASHVVRVQNDPDDGNYVDTELIDELDWIDPVDRAQETHLILNQPPGTYDSNSGMYIITADPTDPDITDTSGNIDPAWRLDPFQNIVGYSGGYYLVFTFLWTLVQTWEDRTVYPKVFYQKTSPLVVVTPNPTPAGAFLLYNGPVLNPDGSDLVLPPTQWQSGNQMLVWDVPALPTDDPLTMHNTMSFNCKITGQADYSNVDFYKVGTGLNGLGLDITDPEKALISTDQFPLQAFTLYPKTTFIFDPHQGGVVPRDPTASPAPSPTARIAAWAGVYSSINQVLNSDTNYDYYAGSAGPPFGPAGITGGQYMIVGLFNTGGFTIEAAIIDISGHLTPTIWPSWPAMRQVPFVNWNAANDPPPPLFNFGQYYDINGLIVPYGLPPLPQNKYIGNDTTNPPFIQ